MSPIVYHIRGSPRRAHERIRDESDGSRRPMSFLLRVALPAHPWLLCYKTYFESTGPAPRNQKLHASCLHEVTDAQAALG